MPKLAQVEALLAVHQSFRRVLIRAPMSRNLRTAYPGAIYPPSLTPIVPHPIFPGVTQKEVGQLEAPQPLPRETFGRIVLTNVDCISFD